MSMQRMCSSRVGNYPIHPRRKTPDSEARVPTMDDKTTILLAEDREDDIILIQRAFKTGGINYPLMVVRDGEEAISYLSGVGRYSNREIYPIPSLFLLDLTL